MKVLDSDDSDAVVGAANWDIYESNETNPNIGDSFPPTDLN